MVTSEEECKSLPKSVSFPEVAGVWDIMLRSEHGLLPHPRRLLSQRRLHRDDRRGVCGRRGSWSAYDQCSSVTCPGDDCPADVNGDGLINVLDLLSVISAWGDCP